MAMFVMVMVLFGVLTGALELTARVISWIAYHIGESAGRERR